MQTVYVQFSDTSETVIMSVFSCPQDPAVWPNQGVIPSNDSRYESYFGTIPALMQKGMVAPGS
jgi:hypothetical protein